MHRRATMSTEAPLAGRFDRRIADVVAVVFTLVILLYAASGPISEFVRWVIEATSPGFDALSRRDQRVFLREHWLGASYRSFEQSVLLPTGLIIGLPIVLPVLGHASWHLYRRAVAPAGG